MVRTALNNGIKGFIEEDSAYLNEGNTISFGQDTATMFYQGMPYFTGDKIKVLKSKYSEFNAKNAQFLLPIMSKSFSKFSWGSSSFSTEIIENQPIQLPTQNGKIDFAFMENFIAELKALRVAELHAYLQATGLSNYTLTDDELAVIEQFNNGKMVFNAFEYQDIFDRIQQGRRLKKDDQIAGDIPFVMSGVTNTGVVNYISNPIAVFPKNSITMDIFGNAFYRSYDYGMGDDTGAYWDSKNRYTRETLLYLTTAMNKSVEGKFSYGYKLRSSQSLNIEMLLPIKNNQPNFEFMETFISAIQKLVIKDVVDWADREIETTEQVIHKN